jgi:signal peptidase II
LNRRRLAAAALPLVGAIIVVSDQVTKHLVRTNLLPGETWQLAEWLRPVVQVTHVTNTGVAFGMFQGLGAVSAVISALISVFIIIYQRQVPVEQKLMRLSLGLMLGGAVGNLIDRAVHGYVVDFIDLTFWPLRSFPVWNVADSAVTVGTVVLLLLMVLEERREAASRRSAESG